MQASTTKIGDKVVKLCRAHAAPEGDLVGMEDVLTKIRAALRGGPGRPYLYPLLVGDPGVGKNRLVYEVARMCRKQLFVFEGHADVRADDLSAGVCISDDTRRKLDYMFSAIATAMILGQFCLLDEIGKIRDEGYGVLSSVLDDRRSMKSLLLYDYIDAHPDFRLIAATNSEDLDSGRIPKWLLSRLKPVIEVKYPSREDINRILQAHHPVLRQDSGRMLDAFWKFWRERNGARPVSPRESIQIFSMALNLADDEADQARGCFQLGVCGSGANAEEKHFRQAFDIFHPSDKKGSQGDEISDSDEE